MNNTIIPIEHYNVITGQLNYISFLDYKNSKEELINNKYKIIVYLS